MSEITDRFPSVDSIQKRVDGIIDFQRKQDHLSKTAIVNAFKQSVLEDASGLIGSDINTSDWDSGEI